MKAHLLFSDLDFDWAAPVPAQSADVVADLDLTTVFTAMGGGDEFVREVCTQVVLHSLTDADRIRYRQQVAADALAHEDILTALYRLTVETLSGAKKARHMVWLHSPDSVLSGSIELMEYLVRALGRLRAFADEHGSAFTAPGWTAFFAMIRAELDQEYFGEIADHLTRLRFRDGVEISADLGKGLQGRNYVLRAGPGEPQHWWQRLIDNHRNSPFTLTIADRDEAGLRALEELRAHGINLVANALAQSGDHILSFYRMLRAELAFYLGVCELRRGLAAAGHPVCFPTVAPSGAAGPEGVDLRDTALALRTGRAVVGNSVDAAHADLILVTGANQGGKSTFLRSLGIAQVLFQAGCFVTAAGYRTPVYAAVFTHYKREEDASMTSGKLDEELARMAGIVKDLRPGAVVLFNESFAATNEREGSEIARQVVRALRDSGVAVWCVTHLYDFARSMADQGGAAAVFLRAPRQDDGRRTFRLVPGDPLPTSFGPDLYARIFGAAVAGQPPFGPGSGTAGDQQDPDRDTDRNSDRAWTTR